MKASAKHHRVSRVYAKALFLTALESKEVDRVKAELESVVQLLSSNQSLKTVLLTDKISIDRVGLVEDLLRFMQAHEITKRFLLLLAEKGRVVILPEIVEALKQEADKNANILKGEVISANTLSESEIKDLSATFSKRFNKNVVLKPIIDQSIIGGLIVSLGGLTFDGSLKTSMQKIHESLERQYV